MSNIKIQVDAQGSSNTGTLGFTVVYVGTSVVTGFQVALSSMQFDGFIDYVNKPSPNWVSSIGSQSQQIDFAALDFSGVGSGSAAGGLKLGQLSLSGWNYLTQPSLVNFSLITKDNKTISLKDPSMSYDIVVNGNVGLNLANYSGANSFQGGNGIDTVTFTGLKSEYGINLSNGFPLDVKGSNTSAHLTSIERLAFKDVSVAYDLSSNAGTTAKLIGAIFGANSIKNQQYVGIGLHLLDTGISTDDLVSLAINFKLGAGFSKESLVNLLYSNVLNSSPNSNDLKYWVTELSNGHQSPVSLTELAMDLSFNTDNINLTGLKLSGIDFQLTT